jgi:hypothetical protein
MKDRYVVLVDANSHHSYLAAEVALEALWYCSAWSSSWNVPSLPVIDGPSKASAAVDGYVRVPSVVLALEAVVSHQPCWYRLLPQDADEEEAAVAALA